MKKLKIKKLERPTLSFSHHEKKLCQMLFPTQETMAQSIEAKMFRLLQNQLAQSWFCFSYNFYYNSIGNPCHLAFVFAINSPTT